MSTFQIEKKSIYFNCISLKIRQSQLHSDMGKIYCFGEGEIEYCFPLESDSFYFFTIKSTEALISKCIMVRNSTCFGQCLCPSSGVFHSIFGTGTSYTCLTKAYLQDQDGTLFHPDPARKLSSVIYTNIQIVLLFPQL